MAKDKWHGSATVEAAIIMPIFLVMLMTMLMFAMFVYEKAAMRSVCNSVAAEGAAIWQRGETYMAEYYAGGGVPPPETQQRTHIFHIYANYFTTLIDTGKNEKIDILREHAAKEIAKRSFILTAGDVKTDVELDSIIIHKRLIVSAEADYNLPFYSDTSKVSAECVISGQTELVRTIDFATDMLDEPMDGIKEKYGEVIDKLKTLIQKVEIEK